MHTITITSRTVFDGLKHYVDISGTSMYIFTNLDEMTCRLRGARLLEDLIHHGLSCFELAHYVRSLNVMGELCTLPRKHV